MFEEERETVLRTCTDLVTNGVVRNTGSAGNVSIRPAGENDRIVITPSKINYDTMTPEDMLVIDGSGSVVESPSGYEPSSETPMHLNVHDVVEGSRAVVHSHPKNAIALGALEDSIPTVHVDQAYFVGDHVPVIDYVPSGSQEMGQAVSDAVQEAGAVLIRHHGLITIGGDLPEALERTLAIESNASIYHRTATLGDVPPMDDADIQRLQDPDAEL
ncbi:class II aldolase/adducin family protein [Halorhabdus amylolytica]|uniref:class II aldolase/adducin family protein n=1 Tax=Halorhabdus amylolytica TaxID=2559573 RepID=UPI0010AA86B9|nr:class II aldolase/adducin family protein [Halorhabdus amylolytica]